MLANGQSPGMTQLLESPSSDEYRFSGKLNIFMMVIEVIDSGTPQGVAWFNRILTALRRRDDLEDVFGIKRPPRVEARNHFLVVASNALTPPELEYSQWRRALALQDAIEKFEVRIFPRLGDSGYRVLSPSEIALRNAFLCGLNIPRNEYALNEILGK